MPFRKGEGSGEFRQGGKSPLEWMETKFLWPEKVRICINDVKHG